MNVNLIRLIAVLFIGVGFLSLLYSGTIPEESYPSFNAAFSFGAGCGLMGGGLVGLVISLIAE